ncbi:pullulanase-type alpha-1,6-glucosidase [Crocosphaera sp.]|uniref:pullulanase-type alpha-1,6-glucosidase n=1 Tax=Crocosphaera sp. TaxID=2729996 RepID=UPI00261E7CD6|nr:pullulanase-type alpha-1,6-glucosidase [Crocosphaera sp.]MDJ0579350.1 pullulanase-type alpha-1,6-glucosidase [Crocosphaera sp.]
MSLLTISMVNCFSNSALADNLSIQDRRGFWLEESIIAWNNDNAATYELLYDPDSNLTIPNRSGSGISLNREGRLSGNNYPKFPNLDNYLALRIPNDQLSQVKDILKSQIAIAAYDNSGNLIDSTGLQIQGVLDDLYAYSGELGVIYNDGIPELKVWAPTARSVILHRFNDSNSATTSEDTAMNFDENTGVWSLTGDRSWDKQYYLYEIAVYTPNTNRIETNLVTDPYSISLSQNSQRSQILDIYNDPTLKPDGWDSFSKPAFTVPEDMAIYEVHVRDFSRDDQTVVPKDRGKFTAFTYDGRNGNAPLSKGMEHIINLGQSGLTHIHLLPAFDIGSVNEDPSQVQDPDYKELNQYSANSDQQQGKVVQTQNQDSFNWGYDPYHYGVPEGSYATNADDTTRIIEFRKMVQTLNENGLRVVMDVVYNHTFASGLDQTSVFDKVVPGYYYRYDNNGNLRNSSCCSDTAAEFSMMDKLMEDTLVTWAKAYKVDGFRFDLMNLHPVETMTAINDRIHKLTLDDDGINGQDIYLYGEGWDFGSAKEKGIHYAAQFNMAGTGIGTFNDRIRDSLHGGYDQDPLQIRHQGFINGLSYDWNGYEYNNRYQGDLRYFMDRLRITLAGSLQDYEIIDQNNDRVKGRDLNGTGYTKDPQESINYVSKHDNETLYDLNVFKLPFGERGVPFTSMDERVRAQNMALDVIGFAQGIPFFQMASDMLRSKSLDRDSFNSGDWFNRVDFNYQNNNFGVGLPIEQNNGIRWNIMRPLLGNNDLQPGFDDINKSVQHLKEVLAIRKSSPLFRLETSEEIKNRVHFHNMGSNQKDGLIALSIVDNTGEDLDPNYEYIVVLFNANKMTQNITISETQGMDLSLHSVQLNSEDNVVKNANFNGNNGEFSIPARTTAVFVSVN